MLIGGLLISYVASLDRTELCAEIAQSAYLLLELTRQNKL